MTASIYSMRLVAGYMRLMRFLVAHGRHEMVAFIRVEPAGQSGWHVFATPDGMHLGDFQRATA